MVKQQFSFEISKPGETWRVKIRREDNRVIIALHWGDKEVPTHEFEETARDFARMAGLLIPEINYAPR